ncbi:hypothetical protein C5167_008857 [Papaver somniferum]|uniref:THH1/TOM1/TOM3 domain-containing protein n=1 Tax=Papaver somniferum TaxID=3469 RepID=A0A4Y7JWU6_PAPSO|nr:hypothetical protein C5167_008857 [Papaver somniferum]
MYVLENGDCLPPVLVGVNVFLASVDAVIAFIAFSQLIRIHLRTKQLGWTRQKSLVIGNQTIKALIKQRYKTQETMTPPPS